MPKKPTKEEWPHIDPQSPEYKNYLWRIGNLLILEGTINRHIKNKGFDKKSTNPTSKDYSSSKMSLPKSIGDYLDDDGKWSPVSIEQRQNHLAEKYACAVWPLQW
jgi:hypothetical protein